MGFIKQYKSLRYICSVTNLRSEAVISFIDKHQIDIDKLSDYVIRPHNRPDLVCAVSGYNSSRNKYLKRVLQCTGGVL